MHTRKNLHSTFAEHRHSEQVGHIYSHLNFDWPISQRRLSATLPSFTRALLLSNGLSLQEGKCAKPFCHMGQSQFKGLYTNGFKSWSLSSSTLFQNSWPRSRLTSRQWSLAPVKNFDESPCQTLQLLNAFVYSYERGLFVYKLRNWSRPPLEIFYV